MTAVAGQREGEIKFGEKAPQYVLYAVLSGKGKAIQERPADEHRPRGHAAEVFDLVRRLRA